jgi:predicted permease
VVFVPLELFSSDTGTSESSSPSIIQPDTSAYGLSTLGGWLGLGSLQEINKPLVPSKRHAAAKWRFENIIFFPFVVREV